MHLAGFCCDASQLLMLVMCVVVEVVLTLLMLLILLIPLMLLMLLILPVVHIVPAVPMAATLLMLVAYVLSTVPMSLPDAAAARTSPARNAQGNGQAHPRAQLTGGARARSSARCDEYFRYSNLSTDTILEFREQDYTSVRYSYMD